MPNNSSFKQSHIIQAFILSTRGTTSMQYEILNAHIYHAHQYIIWTNTHNTNICLSINNATSNQYQSSYSTFGKRICISCIQFSIKVCLLTLNVTVVPIVNMLQVIVETMILHGCCALLFHISRQRNAR